jgi:predicted PhzF superfamily epimerase YddE/YHI9
MTSLEFAVVDVFADRPLAGNPLAVVYSATLVAEGRLHLDGAVDP